MNRKSIWLILLIPFFIANNTTTASANAGTPLMWASMFHLAFGNFIIGLLEAVVIVKYFKVKSQLSGLWMIPANYISCVLGFIIIGLAGMQLPGVTIIQLGWFLTISIISLIAITIILEWPFCFLVLRKEEDRLRKSIKASIIAQLFSYAILIIYFSCFSTISLYTQVGKSKSLDFSQNNNCFTYYISDTGDIYRVRMNGEDRKQVGADRIESRSVDISFAKYPNKDSCDLRTVGNGKNNKTLITDIECKYGSFGDEEKSLNYIWGGFWPNQGFNIGGKTNLAIETPLFWTFGKRGIALNNNQMVFVTSNSYLLSTHSYQIYLLDETKMKMALLAHGRSPAVVCMDE